MPTENTTETKSNNESPKPDRDAKHAAAHNPFAAFDPMAIWQAFQTQMNAWTSAQPGFPNPVQAWTAAQQTFTKAMTDSMSRAQSWSDEYAAIEQQMLSRANAAIDTWAQLAHDSLAYTAQLSSQARKLSMEAARKAGVAGL
jgi:hypothetical protein